MRLLALLPLFLLQLICADQKRGALSNETFNAKLAEAFKKLRLPAAELHNVAKTDPAATLLDEISECKRKLLDIKEAQLDLEDTCNDFAMRSLVGKILDHSLITRPLFEATQKCYRDYTSARKSSLEPSRAELLRILGKLNGEFKLAPISECADHFKDLSAWTLPTSLAQSQVSQLDSTASTAQKGSTVASRAGNEPQDGKKKHTDVPIGTVPLKDVPRKTGEKDASEQPAPTQKLTDTAATSGPKVLPPSAGQALNETAPNLVQELYNRIQGYNVASISNDLSPDIKERLLKYIKDKATRVFESATVDRLKLLGYIDRVFKNVENISKSGTAKPSEGKGSFVEDYKKFQSMLNSLNDMLSKVISYQKTYLEDKIVKIAYMICQFNNENASDSMKEVIKAVESQTNLLEFLQKFS